MDLTNRSKITHICNHRHIFWLPIPWFNYLLSILSSVLSTDIMGQILLHKNLGATQRRTYSDYDSPTVEILSTNPFFWSLVQWATLGKSKWTMQVLIVGCNTQHTYAGITVCCVKRILYMGSLPVFPTKMLYFNQTICQDSHSSRRGCHLETLSSSIIGEEFFCIILHTMHIPFTP